jgi:hypothetical protein
MSVVASLWAAHVRADYVPFETTSSPSLSLPSTLLFPTSLTKYCHQMSVVASLWAAHVRADYVPFETTSVEELAVACREKRIPWCVVLKDRNYNMRGVVRLRNVDSRTEVDVPRREIADVILRAAGVPNTPVGVLRTERSSGSLTGKSANNNAGMCLPIFYILIVSLIIFIPFLLPPPPSAFVRRNGNEHRRGRGAGSRGGEHGALALAHRVPERGRGCTARRDARAHES